MSRLVILSLRPSVDSAALRSHFNVQDFTVTDAKVVNKPDGSSRGIGFVGFKDDVQATRAQNYFNGTWLHGGRIKIDIAQHAKERLARPRKRLRLSPPKDLQAQPTVESGNVAPIEDTDEAMMTDREYMAKRMRRTLADVEMPPAQLEVKPNTPAIVDDLDQDADEAAIAKTGRLFLRNLPFTVTENELQAFFTEFGTVEKIHLPVDKATHSAKGTAFVTFAEPDSAIDAFRAADGQSFQGRLLHIMPAVERAITPLPERQPARLPSLKTRRHVERTASSQPFQWASLFMNADTVAAAAAASQGVSKADIVGNADSDAAVRLALAETAVIGDTKRYLEENGVSLSSFEDSHGRSLTSLLVKNLPFGTSHATIDALFSSHGPLTRLLVPPTGAIAIVEYADEADAAAAYRTLAYRRVGNVPVYLERAPASIWSAPSTMPPAPPLPVPSTHATAPSHVASTGETAAATLFLKNLSFSTTTDRLAATFSHLSDFVFARVQTKPDPRRPSDRLSMGFGFVGFKTTRAATMARSAMHGFSLDGHALEVTFARRGEEPVDADGRKGTATGKAKGTAKIIVKNLPFEATKKDVRDLFSAYGNVKSMRMPRKLDHGTRGFAFLEFASAREADVAVSALRHTHLLGRHLVIERAAVAGDAEVSLHSDKQLKRMEEARRTLDDGSSLIRQRPTRLMVTNEIEERKGHSSPL